MRLARQNNHPLEILFDKPKPLIKKRAETITRNSLNPLQGHKKSNNAAAAAPATDKGSKHRSIAIHLELIDNTVCERIYSTLGCALSSANFESCRAVALVVVSCTTTPIRLELRSRRRSIHTTAPVAHGSKLDEKGATYHHDIGTTGQWHSPAGLATSQTNRLWRWRQRE